MCEYCIIAFAENEYREAMGDLYRVEYDAPSKANIEMSRMWQQKRALQRGRKW